jgi:carbon monoxide dehydrogenase subunit G
MHFEGTHKFNAPQNVMWDLLNDPDVLARATPGIKSLEPLAEDKYKAIIDVKMGPINTTFNGTLEIADKIPPQSYKLLIDVDAKIGIVKAEGTLALEGEDENTDVAFTADAQLSGTLARMGQRVLSGVARMMTKQFFKALEEEVPQQ